MRSMIFSLEKIVLRMRSAENFLFRGKFSKVYMHLYFLMIFFTADNECVNFKRVFLRYGDFSIIFDILRTVLYIFIEYDTMKPTQFHILVRFASISSARFPLFSYPAFI